MVTPLDLIIAIIALIWCIWILTPDLKKLKNKI